MSNQSFNPVTLTYTINDKAYQTPTTFSQSSGGIDPTSGVLPVNPLLQAYMNSVSLLSTGIDDTAQQQLSNIDFYNSNYNPLSSLLISLLI